MDGSSGSGSNSGSAYVFVRNGTTWTEQAKLIASDAAADDLFGYSVALSGDTAILTRDGWKLIDQRVPGRLRFRVRVDKLEKEFLLFNLKDDPFERNDLSDRMPEKVQQLKALMEKEVGRPRRDLAMRTSETE